MPDLTNTIHTYLTTAPTSYFLQQEVQMVEQWQGRDHLLWRVECQGQAAVLKLFLDAGQVRSRRQHAGQQLFAPLGIAPRPLWVDRYPIGLARQVLIYEWMPGDALDPANRAQMAAFARSVAQVHNGDVGDVGRFSPNPVNLAYLWRVLGGSIAPTQRWLHERGASELLKYFTSLIVQAGALVEAALPLWANTPPTPVHGDLKLENCIDSFGTAVLLDWELFGLGDPALEVATFLYWSQSEWDSAAQADWVATYLENFEQPGLAQRIAVYGQILPLQALCSLLDGLRQQTAADVARLTESLPFLKATLEATLHQAAAALQVEVTNGRESVEALFIAPVGT